jgi:uncharacterized protein
MKAATKTPWNPDRMDVRAFAQAGAQLAIDDSLAQFGRLRAEVPSGADDAGWVVSWVAQGEVRPGARGSEPGVWLHLRVQAQLPLACQRCLAPVPVALEVDRWFRFVNDEVTAAAEDEDSEEDVLALEPRPNLRELIEDELLMELPLVPMHETCPQPVLMSAGAMDGAVSADGPPRKNPFAELAKLKK